jgi:hypothetical protein
MFLFLLMILGCGQSNTQYPSKRGQDNQLNDLKEFNGIDNTSLLNIYLKRKISATYNVNEVKERIKKGPKELASLLLGDVGTNLLYLDEPTEDFKIHQKLLVPMALKYAMESEGRISYKAVIDPKGAKKVTNVTYFEDIQNIRSLFDLIAEVHNCQVMVANDQLGEDQPILKTSVENTEKFVNFVYELCQEIDKSPVRFDDGTFNFEPIIILWLLSHDMKYSNGIFSNVNSDEDRAKLNNLFANDKFTQLFELSTDRRLKELNKEEYNFIIKNITGYVNYLNEIKNIDYYSRNSQSFVEHLVDIIKDNLLKHLSLKIQDILIEINIKIVNLSIC